MRLSFLWYIHWFSLVLRLSLYEYMYYLLKFQVFPGVGHGLEAVPLLLEPDVLCVQLLTLQPHLGQKQVLFLCLKSSQHKKICQILPYVSNS
jgi:hypothetical protein